MAISNMWENGFAQQLIPNDFVLKKKKDLALVSIFEIQRLQNLAVLEH